MMEASLIIELPDTWMSDICGRHKTTIHIQRCLPYGSTGGRSLIEIDEGEDPGMIVGEIQKHPAVERVEITRTDGGKVAATVVNRTCRAGQILAASDCFMVGAQSLDGGRVRWKLITGREGSLQALVDELRRAGSRVDIERVRAIKDKSILTRRQEEVLSLALREGYYDMPKRVHLSQLAKRLGISPSSLGELLKRAERTVIEEHLREL
ncbi:MAG: helix-turn-helix domain-containing protein [Methanomassiliicoccus sp.]|nr:helix-turn-helix domain-containing protein [Methanomassiliicoccus sp.]